MKNNKGYTFIEMLIVISLIGVVMTVVSSLYISNINVFKDTLEKSSIQIKNKSTVKRIKDDVLQGIKIEEIWVDGGTTYTSSTNQIIINVPSVSADDNWIYSGPDLRIDHIVYWTDGNGDLWRRVDATYSNPTKRQSETAHVVARGATLTFTYNEAPSTGNTKKVDIELQIQKSANGENYSNTNKTSALLRNK
ncbi:TPA: hypothetical protein DDW69_02750 [candidate division CPR2 bacterium]|uniref:Prepilin-type N-terminal cleavage/methylation domain-containing protein n=1 Tax=candidate division CPR2 bacterium GW2011_GWC1_41_48 TaxID=1618344 RepID=A0A0G0WAU7_UNCC2|nr:MAG: hypothetical protein UT47_C0003G0248 [candidate division CPR2 bacterium GW2011_GWC2_39_35]KKR28187.1 MAG: hypothetical protein UT59_C0033G0004 [candidate division CPR2 bacterium GW2011_GWD1_39_7]KKR29279.1 MAG: hypothetical protein UT60_C0004G0016 [candidate division CPR2 bacterium GW2011_GWD2_39_7]KKS09187.1 MAG: hypothetical protein UU65_C0003G0242 [candidate division CPR2 bacterium GW2011_GWC1_41_48]OGB60356.1 MAG: hypothetical protein A2Y27_03085 [candidate division CPR2 bacterium G